MQNVISVYPCVLVWVCVFLCVCVCVCVCVCGCLPNIPVDSQTVGSRKTVMLHHQTCQHTFYSQLGHFLETHTHTHTHTWSLCVRVQSQRALNEYHTHLKAAHLFSKYKCGHHESLTLSGSADGVFDMWTPGDERLILCFWPCDRNSFQASVTLEGPAPGCHHAYTSFSLARTTVETFPLLLYQYLVCLDLLSNQTGVAWGHPTCLGGFW